MRVSIERTPRPFLAALAAPLLLAVACGAQGPEEAGGVGEPAPPFELAALDGRSLSLENLAGQVVLVDFWATWCQPCHIQADILKEIYPDFRPKGVEFVAVSVAEERDVVESFVRDRPFPYPVALDPDASYANRVGVYGFPTLMILDRQGRVAFFEPGITRAPALREILGDLVET